MQNALRKRTSKQEQKRATSGSKFGDFVLSLCGVRVMALQHAEDRQRLGGDMLDQREETRAITAKAEQLKAAKAMESERKALIAEHEDACIKLRQQCESDMVCVV